ncbi:hypothetical protein R1sor_011070 [Riccia sorocarpa]|uniref:Cytochrome P450 n=1 Tax=Riccia sorocarpa TaxID=122646 RepID=A0ABD3I5W0_9MARC
MSMNLQSTNYSVLSPWLPDFAVLVSGLLVTVSLLLIASSTRKGKLSKRSLPGPQGWPVLGCIPLMGKLPYKSLTEMAKKYGPLMLIRLGSADFVVASSANVAEAFLKQNDKVWSSRHENAAGNILFYGCQDISQAPYGDRWRYARKIFVLELFTAKRLSNFREIRKQEIMRGVNDAIERCCTGTKAVRMDVIVGKISTNNVTRMMMNDSEGTLSDEASAIKASDQFQQAIKEFAALLGSFYLGDFIPWLDRIDPQGLKKRMHAVQKKFDTFLQKIIDDHKLTLEAARSRGQVIPDDVVFSLLTRPRDADGQYLTETEMKAILLDMIVAGTDTNTVTIEWALSELLKNPCILEKAQAEMDSVVGRERLVNESDLPNLPYLNAFVMETFRLHPAGAFIRRKSIEDCEIQGYKIPAKTPLMVNIYAIHRDPEVYDRASEFLPERFLNRKMDLEGQDFSLLIFGSGRRMCPGKGLGIVFVPYCLALFIQTCNFSLLPGLKPEDLDMEEKFGITISRRNPLQVVLVPRLQINLLQQYRE